MHPSSDPFVVSHCGSVSLSPSVDAAILSSWDRCNELRLPVSGLADYQQVSHDRLVDLRQQNHSLLEKSRPHLETLASSVSSAGWSIMLTNDQATTIKAIRSNTSASNRALAAAFREGVQLEEENVGTSAMSCALNTGRFVTVFAEEHFRRFHHGLHCAAVPVFGTRGDIIGSIDITNPRPIRDMAAFSMLQQCAANIQLDLMSTAFTQAVVVEFFSAFGSRGLHDNPILAVDDSGNLLGFNPAAISFFGIQTDEQTPLPAFQQLLQEPLTRVLDDVSPGPIPVHLESGIRVYARILKQPPRPISQPRASDRQPPATNRQEFSAIQGFGDADIHQQLQRAVRVIAKLPVLIQGESGSGKEVAAAAIHQSSPARGGKLVSVNCAAIPESLIESELFGYEKGAFTGAGRQGYIGKIAEADGGTLFLDEIGDMPVELQTRLLRVLETREIHRLGSNRQTRVNFQLICATHQTLPALIEAGRFRQDLYFRISGFQVSLSPFSQRADKLDLVQRLLEDITDQPRQLATELTRFIQRYPWPGNVRQLRHALMYADTITEAGEVLTLHSLPPDLLQAMDQQSNISTNLAETTGPAVQTNGSPQPASLEVESLEVERLKDSAIQQALTKHNGNVTRAARDLGLARSTLYRRLGRLAK